MKIQILRSAKADLLDAFQFYEQQQEGIGSYFLEAISTDIKSLKLYAGIHPVFFEKYYRLLSKRFPFAIYYKIEHDEIRVYAIFDCRKNPAGIREKLQ